MSTRTAKKSQKRRVIRPNLEQLGVLLAKIDRHLIMTLKKRMELAHKVEEYKSLEEKDPNKQTIIRPNVETERLQAFSKLAEKVGLSPDFARVILWAIIAESCRIQIDQKQKREKHNRKGGV
jgi:chorismate mutase